MSISIKELDVRPILRDGGEPFPAIMNAVADLGPDEGLRLIATFRPVPLFSVMAKRGFDHADKEIGGGEWEVVFTPKTAAVEVITSPETGNDPDTWPDPSEYLDLADLDPPEPMERILAAAERMPAGSVIFALLSREPIFLYAELMRRGHRWAGNFDESRTAFRMFVRVGEAGD